MSYSIDEISIINQSGLAENGLLYYTIDGNAYKGTPEGRLTFVDPDFVQLQDSVQSIDTLVEENLIVKKEETIPIVEEDSYFAIDSEGDLTPLNFISNLLVDNIFKLNTVNGDLNPSESESTRDEFFEIDSNGDITPKVL